MRTIHEHVDSMFRDIPDSERKENLKREIIGNLEEKVADLMAQGKAEEDAINRAIVDFGDISDIRDELRMQQQLPIKRTNAGNLFGFSIFGSALIIALFLFVNLYFSPGVLWCVFPIFGVLWWPLAMYFSWRRWKQERR